MNILLVFTLVFVIVQNIIPLWITLKSKKTSTSVKLSFILLNFGILFWQISLWSIKFVVDNEFTHKLAFAFSPWAVLGVTGLAFTYPNRSFKKRRRNLFMLAAFFVFVLSLLSLSTDLIVRSFNVSTDTLTFGVLSPIFFVFLALLLITVVIESRRRYQREKKHMRLYYRYVLLSAGLTGSITLISNLVLPIFVPQFRDFTFYTSISTLILTLSISYTVVAQRLHSLQYLIYKGIEKTYQPIIIIVLAILIQKSKLSIWPNSNTIYSSIYIAFVALIGILLMQGPISKVIENIQSKIYPIESKLKQYIAELKEQLLISTNQGVVFESLIKKISSLTQTEAFLVVKNKGIKESENIGIYSSGGEKVTEEHSLNDLKEILTETSKTIKKRNQEIVYDVKEKNKSKKSITDKTAEKVNAGIILGYWDTNFIIAIIVKKGGDFDVLTQEVYQAIQDLSHQTVSLLDKFAYLQKMRNLQKTLQQKVDKATSQLRERNQELEQLYNDLEQLYQKEKDLMDIAGHEFRTPASIIKTNLHMLKSRLKKLLPEPEVEDEKISKYFERLMDSTDRQIRLINTFLESARIENERFELHIETADFVKLIADAVHDHEESAKAKRLNLKFDEPDKKMNIEMDPVRMREVIDNLLSNAIKYTKSGYVEVKLSETSDKVRCEVHDTGIGIKEEHKSLLFKKFSRLEKYIGGDEGKIVKPGGTGLGLFVAKNVVDHHGGDIWVESEVGKGSTFIFEIPKKQKGTKSRPKKKKNSGSKLIKPEDME